MTAVSRLVLFGVAFIGGWAIMMLEILGGRVLAPYFGYSVYQWGALIGVVMSALALGYYLGGKIGDRPGASRFVLFALIISAIFVLVVPRFAEQFMPVMRSFGPAWGAVFGTLILLGVPSVLLATISPIVIRLTASNLIAKSAGQIYAVSTVGSIGGTFFTTFYAIPDIGTRVSHYLAAGLLMLAVIAMAIVARQFRPAIAAIVILGLGYPFAQKPQAGEIYRAESIHNIIRVVDTPDNRVLFLNYTLGAQTTMSKTGLLTGAYYDFYLMGPQINDARSVLFLGVAGGTALRQLVKVYPKLEVTGIELDPAVIYVARKYFGLASEPRIKLIAGDARWYLATENKKYDIIALDLFVTGQTPFFTTTVEFFQLTYDRLSDNGIIIMNVLSATGSGELLRPLVRTVRKVFPSTFFVSYGNYMLVASKQPMSLVTLREILNRRGRTKEAEQVLVRARPTLRAASVTRKGPIFTDDKNDVEFRTFRTFYGR
jgi:spermidine synthase